MADLNGYLDWITTAEQIESDGKQGLNELAPIFIDS